MRRTTQSLRTLRGGLLLALLLAGVAGNSLAQKVDLKTADKAQIVPLNGSIHLKMSTGKTITKVVTSKAGVVRAQPIPGDPTTIVLVGLQVSDIRLDLTDVDGKTETVEISVQDIK